MVSLCGLMALVAVILANFETGSVPARPLAPRDGGPNRAIERLRSPSVEIREAAKRDIMRMGPAAAGPLTRALRELISDRHPRFEIGHDREGREAVARREAQYARHAKGKTLEEQDGQLPVLVINRRLGKDYIDLLVAHKAKPAVPVLIGLLWKTDFVKPTSHATEMNALRDLGPVAVSGLISELENAVKVARRRRTDLGIPDLLVLGCRRQASRHRYRVDSGLRRPWCKHTPEYDAGKGEADVVQQRIIALLSDIGDPRAIQPLESLARSSDSRGLAIDAKGAALKIRQRNQ